MKGEKRIEAELKVRSKSHKEGAIDATSKVLMEEAAAPG
jgi:hypothetical protein